MKSYSAFPKAPPSDCLVLYRGQLLLGGGSYPSAEMHSQCILKPQLTGQSLWSDWENTSIDNIFLTIMTLCRFLGALCTVDFFFNSPLNWNKYKVIFFIGCQAGNKPPRVAGLKISISIPLVRCHRHQTINPALIHFRHKGGCCLGGRPLEPSCYHFSPSWHRTEAPKAGINT